TDDDTARPLRLNVWSWFSQKMLFATLAWNGDAVVSNEVSPIVLKAIVLLAMVIGRARELAPPSLRIMPPMLPAMTLSWITGVAADTPEVFTITALPAFRMTSLSIRTLELVI